MNEFEKTDRRMDIKIAIINLSIYNRWLKGEFDTPPISQEKITESIDIIEKWCFVNLSKK